MQAFNRTRVTVIESLIFLTVFFLCGVAVFAQRESEALAGSAAKSSAATHDTKQDLATTEDAMGDMHHHSDPGEGPGHQHQMGPHMRMSTLQPQKPEDTIRAQKIADEARAALEHYRNFRDAEADGFKIFLPNTKQKMYHFTNWKYAVEAAFRFNPSHPTSLLYEKIADDDYKLIGAMYTAPQRYSEEQLNQRIPLSVAQWHQHVNLCMPPRDRRQEMFGPNPRFGLQGSIIAQSECESAGGSFKPVVFGWMVHFYPYEKSMDQIWSVERQLPGSSMAGMSEHRH